MKQINLENIIKQHRGDYISDVFNTKEVLELMKQACLETLELAAELVEIRLKEEGQIKAYLLDGSSILKLNEFIK